MNLFVMTCQVQRKGLLCVEMCWGQSELWRRITLEKLSYRDWRAAATWATEIHADAKWATEAYAAA